MNRSASAPSPLKASPAKASPQVRSKKLKGQSFTAGAGPLSTLGRAGEGLLLPSSAGGLYLLGGDSPDVRPRLPHFAASHLWTRHSSQHLVRDLYAGYAADPLAPGPRKQVAASCLSSAAGTPREDGLPRPSFLERYVRQQADIEKMLNEWQPPVVQVEVHDEEQVIQKSRAASLGSDNAGSIQAVDKFGSAPVAFPLHVTAKTRNVTFQGDVMTCALKSGGVRLSPPEEFSFRLCVRPLDPPETHPFYIGMVPAGVTGSEVHFLNDRREGIFLRVGGYPPDREAIDGAPLDENDPLKPEFQIFGERVLADLPLPLPNRGVALHFYEMFPRNLEVLEKIQCKECKKLFDTTEQFAEHVFDDPPGHSEEFGFDSCRRVEQVSEQDYNFDQNLAKMCVRFQVENRRNGREAAAFSAEPQSKSLRKGVPSLPRELDELVGGRPMFGPPGPWELCVLLCKPDTRLQISWLPAGTPEKPPKPPWLRPAAGGSKVKIGLPGSTK